MRLIDADRLREGWLEWNPYEIIEANTVLESIDEQPTVDPVVHGQIVTITDRWHTMSQECSVCGEQLPWKEYPNFCFNCGAKLDLKED